MVKSAPASSAKSSKGKQPVSISRLGLLLAWRGWLKTAILIAIAIVFGLGAQLDLIPMRVVSLAATFAVLVAPAFIVVRHYRERKADRGRLVLAGALCVLAMAAAAYPLAMAFFPKAEVEAHFNSAGEEQPLPVVDGGHEWVAEVHAPLVSTDSAYQVTYDFLFDSPAGKTPLEGRLSRSWSSVRAGYKKIGKQLVNNDRRVHHVSLDLAQSPSTLKLAKLNGQLAGPIEILLHPEPVTWLYLAAVSLPLALATAGFSLVETRKAKLSPVLVAVLFWLLFSFFYADNAMPDVWFKPFVFAVVAGGLAAYATSWVIHRVFGPLLSGAEKR
ncbi:MAG: hypothetical protein C4523_02815 [Myxococcales bacterium]|nr:MAG: hypothetical protein C4523_02815 [Myxococcales bacterium]